MLGFNEKTSYQIGVEAGQQMASGKLRAELSRESRELQAESRTNGIAEGRTQERRRMRMILTAKEAQQRPVRAQRLALDTDLAADVVIKELAASKIEELAVDTAFTKMMATIPNPRVGPDRATDENDTGVDAMAAAGRLVSGGSI